MHTWFCIPFNLTQVSYQYFIALNRSYMNLIKERLNDVHLQDTLKCNEATHNTGHKFNSP